MAPRVRPVKREARSSSDSHLIQGIARMVSQECGLGFALTVSGTSGDR